MTLGLLPTFANTAALRYFYEAAQHMSFRVASDKIRIAPSAIGRQVQLLEEELKTKLFVRNRNGLQLTPAGEALLFRVKRIMNELSVACDEIEALQPSSRAHIRLGLNDTVARDFFLEFFRVFRASHPHVSFDLKIANSDELTNLLVERELDIIVGYAVQPREGMRYICSFDLEHCVTIRNDHELADRGFVTLSDIVDETFIMPSQGSTVRRAFDAMFASSVFRPAIPITTNSYEFIAFLVSEGFGISFQLRLVSGIDRKRSDIRHLPIKDTQIGNAALACCVLEGGQESELIASCADHLRESLQQWRRSSRCDQRPYASIEREQEMLYA